ncbi:hypothetical protein ES708_21125 [subsurface metagenome]
MVTSMGMTILLIFSGIFPVRVVRTGFSVAERILKALLPMKNSSNPEAPWVEAATMASW